jgi:SAM-dependent methyltransferase
MNEAIKRAVRQRFEDHRRAWEKKEALRALYSEWYGRAFSFLPKAEHSIIVEIGSGPGFAASFRPDLVLTDIVSAPWLDLVLDGRALPFAESSISGVLLFDVLHHLPDPSAFLDEVVRCLRPTGRLVLCEPYLSLVSYPVYKWFHEETTDARVNPFVPDRGKREDPMESNQAIPTLMFGSWKKEFQARYPTLGVICSVKLAGLSYPATGGFSSRMLLPLMVWRVLHRIEQWIPATVFRACGFRMLVVLEKSC